MMMKRYQIEHGYYYLMNQRFVCILIQSDKQRRYCITCQLIENGKLYSQLIPRALLILLKIIQQLFEWIANIVPEQNYIDQKMQIYLIKTRTI